MKSLNGGAEGYYAEQQKLNAIDPEELGMTSGEHDAMKILSSASEQIYAQLQEREELELELERIKIVQSEHNELHPPTNTEECPICLESIQMGNADALIYFPCCGNGYCKKCDEDNYKDVSKTGEYRGKDPRKIATCPMCRTKLTHTDAEQNKQIEKLAKKGLAWAQNSMGKFYYRGIHGKNENSGMAFKWFKLASDQGYPPSMSWLGDMYKRGDGVAKNLSKAKSLWVEASKLGNSVASVRLAELNDFSGEEAVYYATLSYSQDNSSPAAAHVLGKVFYYGQDGLEKSLIRARHYFEVAANGGEEAAYSFLAYTLVQLSQAQYNTLFGIPGHCNVPRAMYWLRKVTDKRFVKEANMVMMQLESTGKKSCAHCHKKADSATGALKQCSKCKAMWYCSKECQVEAWKMGHRGDCNFDVFGKTPNVMGTRSL